MRLYLLQHGEAVPEKVNPDRPLTDRGERDVRKIASFLKDAGVGPVPIVHSEKTRARQTAEILASALGSEIREREKLGPNDAVQDLAEELSATREDLMIVGHLPYLARLASLVMGSEKSILAFRPGGVVCIERSGENLWQVAWMVTPELLP